LGDALAGSGPPGRIEAGRHFLRTRIYYEDTDAAGRVYYANYLKFAERARTEALFALGWDIRQLAEEEDATFVVRRCEAEFLAPAVLGDIVEISTSVTRSRGAGFTMDQAISRDGLELARMVVDLACINRLGKPRRVPPPLRQALAHLT
jgi:acyl-CoA thioester hydrolase